MVAHLFATSFLSTWLLAQAEAPALARLTPEQRTRLFTALLALTMISLLLVSLAWWIARWLRRHSSRRRSKPPVAVRRRGLAADDWASKPLHSRDSFPTDIDS